MQDGQQRILDFSTGSLPQRSRFDFWMSVMDASLWPVTDWSGVSGTFDVRLRQASLGCLSAMSEEITAHRSRRTRADVQRSEASCFHLFLNLSAPWAFTHAGHTERANPGDIVLMADGEHEIRVPYGFKGLILKCPTHWVESWLPDPTRIVGRTISRSSRWGKALSPVLASLSPEFAVSSPVPHNVLVDQVGSLLALAADDFAARSDGKLQARAIQRIRERCTEPALVASDVAQDLGVEVRELHRVLAAGGTGFAAQLVDARMALATPLLTARKFAALSLTDIAKRTGFANASSMSRTVRRRLGRSAERIRHG